MALITSRLGQCLVCGKDNVGCTAPGHRDDPPHIVDMSSEEYLMTDGQPQPLKVYEVEHNGFTATMKLNEDDAKRMGAKALGSTFASAEPDQTVTPSSKARTAPNK